MPGCTKYGTLMENSLNVLLNQEILSHFPLGHVLRGFRNDCSRSLNMVCSAFVESNHGTLFFFSLSMPERDTAAPSFAFTGPPREQPATLESDNEEVEEGEGEGQPQEQSGGDSQQEQPQQVCSMVAEGFKALYCE